MIENKLPENWVVASLQDIAAINPTLDKSAFEDDMEVSFIPMPAVEAETGKTDISQIKKFGEVKKGYTPFQEKDILFAKITPCMENGKMAVVPKLTGDLGFGSTEFHVLRARNDIEPKYIYYFVSSKAFRYDAEHNMTGAVGQRRVPTGFIEAQQVPLPPTNEQKRIVVKIEELFSELDKGVENLKTARAQLKVYRQAVLKHAFGKFKYGSTIGDLFDFTGGGTPSKKEPSYWNGNLPWASVKDIKGSHLLHTIDSITDRGLQNSSANLANPNDVILITRISPGKTVVSGIKAAINQDLKIVNPKTSTAPLFIHYLFKSLEKEIIKLSSGTTVLGINLNNLKSIPAPLLPMTEQQKIVEEIESKFSVIDQTEKDIETNLQKSESLRQSILKKAFSGELVEQDPNDEPASVLLDRIRKEKEAPKPKQKKTKSKRKAA